jgi:hypothetical protein
MIEHLALIFLSGFLLSWGPCLGSCGYIFVPLVAGVGNDVARALNAWFVFSAGRILSYIFLSVAATVCAGFVTRHFYRYRISAVAYIVLGIVLLYTAFLVLRGSHACAPGEYIQGKQGSITKISLFLSGLLVAGAPCLSLFGILSYIGMTAKNAAQASLLGLAFGAGTLLSPLFLFSMGVGFFAKTMRAHGKAFFVLRMVCGALLSAASLFLITKATFILLR